MVLKMQLFTYMWHKLSFPLINIFLVFVMKLNDDRGGSVPALKLVLNLSS